MTADMRRSARLALGSREELANVPEAAFDHPDVQRAMRARGVPSGPVRRAQQMALRLGWQPFASDCLSAFASGRRALVKDSSRHAPRVLIRVDEFPHAGAHEDSPKYGFEAFERFHEILTEAGVPYLLAITPRVSAEYLEPACAEWRDLSEAEVDLARRVLDDGVVPALHGLDHRTRDADPRKHSEFSGLTADETRARVELGMGLLAAEGIRPRVFVPPFNRFDAGQYDVLAELFDVVCGGPETVATLGYQRSPMWRGEAVYLPSYVPLYGRSGEVEVALTRHARVGAGLWIPVTLHWGWEAEDDWRGLQRLARTVAPMAVSWEVFLTEVDASR